MVISTQRKFLFIHVPKNAGSSISHTLRNHGVLTKRPTKHQTLQQIEQEHDLTGYTIFGFVRNPFDRLYSFYNYMRRRNKINTIKTFAQFVDKIRTNDTLFHSWKTIRHMQADYFKSDKYRVNFIGRYEHLNTDWNKVCELLNLELPKLPILNRYSIGEDYRLKYSDEDHKFVQNYYMEDLTEYGYSFK